MPSSSRFTIRLTPALAARVADTVRPGQSLSDLIREALEAYLGGRQTASATASATASGTLADITRRLEAFEQRLTAVEAASAPVRPRPTRQRPFQACTDPHTRARRASTTGPASAADRPPPFDPTRHVLGKLCPRQHDYQGTGHSLLQRSNHKCVLCHRAQARERRQARRPQP